MAEPRCYAPNGSANLEYCHDDGCTKCKFAAGDPSNEIVAFRFGTLIVFDPLEARVLIAQDVSFEMVSRKLMQLMASMDLGENWKRGAGAPTLFLLSELKNGEVPN
jgi:hypothetical protein